MSRPALREKANKAKKVRCKDLIVVLENPKNLSNIGSVIRNIDALGAEKLYVVDGYNILPDNWQDMRTRRKLNDVSASAIKWTFVRKFKTTDECISHLDKKKFLNIVTSPHLKGKTNLLLENSPFTQPRVAVWFGNEAQGVSEKVVDRSIFCVNLEMCGIIESLNLATTTGIVLYEATKQRRNFKKHAN